MQLQSETAGIFLFQNDWWTLHPLGLGLMMFGLSDPVVKLIWLTSTAMTRRTSRQASTADLLGSSAPAACKVALLVKA